MLVVTDSFTNCFNVCMSVFQDFLIINHLFYLLFFVIFHQAMTLMEYLIKTGSERVAQQCRENIYAVQTLKDFQYIDRDGKDQVLKHNHAHKAE